VDWWARSEIDQSGNKTSGEITLEENFAVYLNGAMSASANETWRMREEVSGQASKDEHVETHDRSS
jgi:hypothetical protein